MADFNTVFLFYLKIVQKIVFVLVTASLGSHLVKKIVIIFLKKKDRLKKIRQYNSQVKK